MAYLVDLAQSAGPEHSDDLVIADMLSWFKWHQFSAPLCLKCRLASKLVYFLDRAADGAMIGRAPGCRFSVRNEMMDKRAKLACPRMHRRTRVTIAVVAVVLLLLAGAIYLRKKAP